MTTTTSSTRTADTIALNNRLQIVRLDDIKFPTPNGYAQQRGWGFYIAGKGFIKFKADQSFVPYAPCGGKSALQSIIDDGGFLEYDSLEFILPDWEERDFMLTQYHAMKLKHPDAVLLFRNGDFYETFADDAIACSEILGLVLTRRIDETRQKYIELCGFPHHALDTYLPKIVRSGRRVAICEQLESPKKFVKRGGEPDARPDPEPQPDKRNFHYEYRWRCHNMCHGGMTSETFRNYADRHSYRPTGRGTGWTIEKFRVYD